MEIQYAFFFFISGAILTLICSRLVGLYHGIYLFQKMEEYVSVYVVLNKKMIQSFLEKRRSIASSSGVPKEDIKAMFESDSMLMDVFKKSILVIIKSNYPTRYLGKPKYKNWEELERYAEEVTTKSTKARQQ